jgi:hypothetical protein
MNMPFCAKAFFTGFITLSFNYNDTYELNFTAFCHLYVYTYI